LSIPHQAGSVNLRPQTTPALPFSSTLARSSHLFPPIDELSFLSHDKRAVSQFPTLEDVAFFDLWLRFTRPRTDGQHNCGSDSGTQSHAAEFHRMFVREVKG